MGKFQSKHAAAACKRRESPEGDSFVVPAYGSGRRGAEETDRRAGSGVEHRSRDKQELLNGDPKEGPFWDDKGSLEVVLPPEKSEGHEGQGQLFSTDDGEKAASREGPLRLSKKHLNIDALQCDVSVEEDNRQEWTFTLYDFDNSGKVTREDMSSLMHTIYEVVDASVNHSSGSSKTLRVKLTVSPEPSSKKECPLTGQDREPTRGRTEIELTDEPRVADRRLSAYSRKPNADPQPCSVRVPYCVDENTERRNHYLDLAGIENYTSKFGPGYSHGQDGGHTVQGGDEDTGLTDESREQQGPCGLPVGLSMTKHLQYGERAASFICCTLSEGLTCRKGMIPSRAMACSRRGAPVRLCRPAPQVEKKEPITMTQGDGQASMPMTRFPCKASPNLQMCPTPPQSSGYCPQICPAIEC